MQDLQERLGPFADAFENVMKEVREKFQDSYKHRGMFESLQEFAAAVNWQEPWIIGLISFQAIFLFATIALRQNTTASSILFGIAALVVFNAERLNSLAAQHYQSFTDQPYFDKHGIFFSALISAPLLLSMFILLVNYLITVSRLLIKMKRKELRYKARRRAEAEQPQQNGAESRKNQ